MKQLKDFRNGAAVAGKIGAMDFDGDARASLENSSATLEHFGLESFHIQLQQRERTILVIKLIARNGLYFQRVIHLALNNMIIAAVLIGLHVERAWGIAPGGMNNGGVTAQVVQGDLRLGDHGILRGGFDSTHETLGTDGLRQKRGEKTMVTTDLKDSIARPHEIFELPGFLLHVIENFLIPEAAAFVGNPEVKLVAGEIDFADIWKYGVFVTPDIVASRLGNFLDEGLHLLFHIVGLFLRTTVL